MTVTDLSGCLGKSAPVLVSVLPRPDAVLSGPGAVCLNTDAQFSVSSATGTAFTWSSSRGSIRSGAGSNMVTIRWSQPGADTVRVTVASAAGCTRDTMMIVAVNTTLQPVITANRPSRLCNGESVTLDAGAGYIAYQWSSGETVRTITVSTAGSYSVTVTDAWVVQGPPCRST
ncbi:MAG: PKD domain-containing protein [Ignavibacteria bacterium]|nr:PKD domain-containing protein [Ignavibacteria bacterium]